MSSYATNVAGTLVGCVVRIVGSDDAFLVESCRAFDSSGKVVLRLSGTSGVSIERLTDLNTVAGLATERATKEIVFVRREACPLCCHRVMESKRLFSVRQIFWDIDH